MLHIDDIAARKELITASGLKKGRVLDVGMGNCGCMALFLAKEGFHTVGVDSSPEAVHESEQNAQKESFAGVFEASVAKGEHLPFAGNEFDAVVAYHSLHHMKSIEKIISEMFRVCKPSGFVLIADLHEKGRKAYDHKPDKGKLLKTIDHYVKKYSSSIRTGETKHNMMFICQK
jgi:ubiquinone/menaquinone biosynthesis C-methylase UbiE